MAKNLTFLSKDYFKFFQELARNNRKEWFDENKKRYQEVVKVPFENLVASILEMLGKEDPEFQHLQPSDCIFRINRDVRFAKDKSPYKLNRSAVFNPGGKKSMETPGFYFEIGADTSVCYTGSYMPEAEQLRKVRSKIVQNSKEFDKIINSKKFKTHWGEVLGDKNKKLPPEFAEAGKTLPLVFNKQFYAKHEFDPEIAIEAGFDRYIYEVFKAAMDFNAFLNVK